jgi:hypothetical protein
MSYLSENDYSFSTAQTFPGLHDPSNNSQYGQELIFRNLGLVPSATQVLYSCDAVKTVPHEANPQMVEHHRRDSKKNSLRPS